MKHITVGMLACAIFAAPCAYDAFSQESSPLTGLIAMLAASDKNATIAAERAEAVEVTSKPTD